jgi:catechol 2,3-dioxygenase
MHDFPRVIRIGHVVLSVADLAASRHFYVDLLGFNVVHEDDRALYLRGVEDREWSLKLELGAEARRQAIGVQSRLRSGAG